MEVSPPVESKDGFDCRTRYQPPPYFGKPQYSAHFRDSHKSSSTHIVTKVGIPILRKDLNPLISQGFTKCTILEDREHRENVRPSELKHSLRPMGRFTPSLARNR